MSQETVYVRTTFGTTEVYHGKASCATDRRFPHDHVRETTPADAVEEGLRPCRNCDPPVPEGYEPDRTYTWADVKRAVNTVVDESDGYDDGFRAGMEHGARRVLIHLSPENNDDLT